MRFVARLAAVLMLVPLLPCAADAQIRASERGFVGQTIDGTTIRVEFGRPHAKGRELFGGIVPWGKVWTGANWAFTINADRDIEIDGHPLAKGTYSIWIQPREEGWTAILDPVPHRFHMMPPAESPEQIRFPVTPGTGAYTELLTWRFPEVRPTGATLQMAWGETTVDFDIGVHPSRPMTVPQDVADRYVGQWILTGNPPLRAGESSFDISYDEAGHMVAHWENSPNPYLAVIWLVDIGQGMFIPVETEDGEMVDVLADIVFEFTPLDGRAERFGMRGVDDRLWGEGRRR